MTAVCPDIPDPLVQQLKPQGRLVVPISKGYGHELIVVEKQQVKQGEQHLNIKDILPVRFVPLVCNKN